MSTQWICKINNTNYLFQRNESESDPLEAAASASSALGGDNAAIGDGSEGSENPDGQSGKKKKNRCFSCKKKVGLTGKISRLLMIHYLLLRS